MDNEIELLQKVERGELSAVEAARILEEMQARTSGTVNQIPETTRDENREDALSYSDTTSGDLRRFGRMTRWWVIPYTAGVLITALGAFWLYLGWNGGQITFGFWLAWIPFLMGVALMALSWRARASHWLHLKIHQKSGRKPERFTLSFPLPLGLVKWANRNFGHHFPPEVRGMDLDDFIDAIEDSVTSENPIYVWVDDEEESQQVEVWIGRGADWE